MAKRHQAVHLALAVATLIPTAVQAEPLLLSGRIQYQRNEAGFLELHAPAFSAIGEFGSYVGHPPPGICVECRPGERFNPGGVERLSLAEFGFAEFQYRGRTFIFTSGQGTFSAPWVTVPQATPDGSFATVFAPFTFSGYFEGEDRTTGDQVKVDLTGRGTVGVDFDFARGGWFASSYNFEHSAPVPEPASIFLLGGVLGARLLWSRSRRTR